MTSVSVFNLNTMHGRNCESAIWPLRMGRKSVKYNLLQIANLIRRYDPDIVTLQEIDQFSLMTGGFNQFDFLKSRLNYRHSYFAPSCSIKGIFESGNAIFSKYPLLNCESHRFHFTFPTDRMGFVIADLKIPGKDLVTLASVHTTYLDWLRSNTRFPQLKLLEQVVAGRGNRAIIAGDMNCDLLDDEEYLGTFVNNLGLQAYSGEHEMYNTHPSSKPKKRIDWILPSKGIRFISYDTLSEIVSDHLAVFVNLEI